MPGYTRQESKVFTRLNTPKKTQDFLDSLKINFEEKRETCMSPRFVIKTKKAHCMEAAMFGAAVLEFHGAKPLVLDLRANDHDEDHVVALFRKHGFWGAISKSNHAGLRYREPIYKSVRELAMSYFHEYFDDNGRKNLREYSIPVDLSRFDKLDWQTSAEDLFEIPHYLDRVKHYRMLNRRQIRTLRRADKMEMKAGDLVEWKKKK